MREKSIATEYGSVYYWLSDTWNNEFLEEKVLCS